MENAKNNSTAHNIHVRMLKLCTAFMHTLQKSFMPSHFIAVSTATDDCNDRPFVLIPKHQINFLKRCLLITCRFVSHAHAGVHHFTSQC